MRNSGADKVNSRKVALSGFWAAPQHGVGQHAGRPPLKLFALSPSFNSRKEPLSRWQISSEIPYIPNGGLSAGIGNESFLKSIFHAGWGFHIVNQNCCYFPHMKGLLHNAEQKMKLFSLKRGSLEKRRVKKWMSLSKRCEGGKEDEGGGGGGGGGRGELEEVEV